MSSFSQLTINEFMDALASKASTPGGGAGAAMGGALAASLVSMVCNLTLGKKGYEGAQDELRQVLMESEGLRRQLVALADMDAMVYDQVMAAYRLPKSDADEKVARAEAIQEALWQAAQVPLQIAQACTKVVALARPAAELGNRWAVSDAGVAVRLAESAVHGALLNVTINLQSITDADRAAELTEQMAALTEGLTDCRDAVLALVDERIKA